MTDSLSELPEPVGAPLVPALPYAPWWRRMVGAVIDLFVMGALTLPFVLDRLPDLVDRTASSADYAYVSIVGLLIQISYWTAMHGTRGSTLGKMAARTVLRRVDGSPVDLNIAFVRAVALSAINFAAQFVLLIPSVANAVRPLWHPMRQTWHDQIARTVVLSLEAEKR